MKVFAVGASRHIGYLASLRLLRKGDTVTFLLRNPSVFDADEAIQAFVEKGKARLVAGDALNREDVRHGWEVAGQLASGEPLDSEGQVNVLLFTLGGNPRLSLTGGLILEPPDLYTRTLLNTLCTMPRIPTAPRIVAVTSTGLTPENFASLPLILRLLCRFVLWSPLNDKKGAERVLARLRGAPEPEEDILQEGWEHMEGLPAKGELEGIVVLRPVVLTDGECTEKYRTSEGETAPPGGVTISRQDVAHFLAERVLGEEWDVWQGKGVNLAY